MAHAHEVFISYASQDREWATKLHADLNGRGVDAFFDQTSLRAGEGWEGQIRTALLGSRHLVCLWSAHASASQWVQRELALFDAMNTPAASAGGSLLVVKLDDTFSAYTSLQQIAEAAVTGAYAAGLPTLAAGDWKALVDRINVVVKRDKNALSIPVALLTLTREQAEQFGPAERAHIAARLGMDADGIAGRYGASRLDWQPFGDQVSIDALLDHVRASLNKKLANKQPARTVQWDLPDESFWSHLASAQAFAAAMQQRKLGAIVIDPVALSNVLVQARLGLFTQCLRHENIAVIAVPPFAASPQMTSFRGWIEEFAATMVQSYFDPPLDPDHNFGARCAIGQVDANELRRLVQSSISQFMRLTWRDSQPATPILGN